MIKWVLEVLSFMIKWVLEEEIFEKKFQSLRDNLI